MSTSWGVLTDKLRQLKYLYVRIFSFFPNFFFPFFSFSPDPFLICSLSLPCFHFPQTVQQICAERPAKPPQPPPTLPRRSGDRFAAVWVPFGRFLGALAALQKQPDLRPLALGMHVSNAVGLFVSAVVHPKARENSQIKVRLRWVWGSSRGSASKRLVAATRLWGLRRVCVCASDSTHKHTPSVAKPNPCPRSTCPDPSRLLQRLGVPAFIRSRTRQGQMDPDGGY